MTSNLFAVSLVLILTICLQPHRVSGEWEEDTDDVSADREGSHGWDELVFTQLWGYSACLQFKKQTGGKQKCRYEKQPSIWSIHGIWPTLKGSSGPNFCSKIKFNETLIDPIFDDLNRYWYEISETKDPKGFWEHEWVKHGSCAMQATEFDTELKYFQAGLILRNKYDLYSILKDGGVIPLADKGYTVEEIYTAVGRILDNKKPHLQCLHIQENGKTVYHLLTIEICFSKDMQAINCSGKSQVTSYFAGSLDCPPNEPITYSDINANKRSEL